MIGGAHHLCIVFDYQHRVADVAQIFEQTNQPIVVARMQTDRWLVEHVKRADQRRAEIGRELNSLRFAAGECRCESIESQVVEPDFNQKPQPASNFEKNSFGDRGLFSRELERSKKSAASLIESAQTSGKRSSADFHVARFLTQPAAAAIRTQRVAAILRKKDAHVKLVLLCFQPIEETAHAAQSPRLR